LEFVFAQTLFQLCKKDDKWGRSCALIKMSALTLARKLANNAAMDARGKTMGAWDQI